MPRKDHIQFSDVEAAAWVDTQRQDGESRGRCAGRLLWEYRALLADPVVAGETARLRQIRAILDADITGPPAE